ncbi:hypothetical protein M0R45_017277 [Rubus argutus]|uniref:Uncharacterized protein n=1 Tax=Rubus argutus TaxID=59490 RepID=A0AAW1XV70_RUBAR
MAVNVRVRESTVVKPAAEMPRLSLWIPKLDMMQPHTHTPIVYFYKPNNSDGADKDHNFFDMGVLKHSLSKGPRALLPFGRLPEAKKRRGSYRNRLQCRGRVVCCGQ